MGGNLDATNIVKNTKLAVLVSISMDHMSFLGNTLWRNRREEGWNYQTWLPGCDHKAEAGSGTGDCRYLQQASCTLCGI
mgnify:CR=1 FL=1